MRQKADHDAHAWPCSVEEGDAVLVRNVYIAASKPGHVLEAHGTPTFLVRLEDGHMWWRHLDHIRQVDEKLLESTSDPQSSLDDWATLHGWWRC